jgi:hypothetical protein
MLKTILAKKKAHTDRFEKASIDKISAKPSMNVPQTAETLETNYIQQVSGLSNLNNEAHLNLRSNISKTFENEESTAAKSPIKNMNSIDELWNEDFSQSKYIISQKNIDRVVNILDRATQERKDSCQVDQRIKEVSKSSGIPLKTLEENVKLFIKKQKQNEKHTDIESFNLHSPSKQFKKDVC